MSTLILPFRKKGLSGATGSVPLKSRKVRESKGYMTFQFFNVLLLATLAFATVYPMWHVFIGSVSDGRALMRHSGFLLLPIGEVTLTAYRAVFENPNIAMGYRNTLYILAVGIPLQVVVTSLGAYVLSRKSFGMRNAFMFFISFTMFFQGGMIPMFLLVRDLGLMNNLLSVVLPFTVNAFNLIIMRTSFQAIPESLEESARMDGAGHFTIYSRIVMPLSKAVVAVMILYYGVGLWNGWFWASVFIRNRSLFPLQLILREILIINDLSSMTQGVSGDDMVSLTESIRYATIIVSTLPILTVYPFLQKYFAGGVMIGAIKG
ncbi:MAG: carbohydrate ABC transporter permease [Spirochaetaceae bacterium]